MVALGRGVRRSAFFVGEGLSVATISVSILILLLPANVNRWCC